MHQNEIKITHENLMSLIMEAGTNQQMLEALKEQVSRQHPDNEEMLSMVSFSK